MAKKIPNLISKRNSLRTHRQIFTLNDEENKALTRYITKYKVQNKSKFIRDQKKGTDYNFPFCHSKKRILFYFGRVFINK